MINPNIVLELEAGKQLCKVLDYRLEGGRILPEIEPAPGPGERVPWGHTTCGGTVEKPGEPMGH